MRFVRMNKQADSYWRNPQCSYKPFLSVYISPTDHINQSMAVSSEPPLPINSSNSPLKT